MRFLFFTLAALLILGVAVQVSATVLWSDGFEGYNVSSGKTYGSLDKNDTTGPNTQASNPWWGTPGEPNMFVTKAMANPAPMAETVNPHTGLFMARAAAGTSWYNSYDGDNSHANLAYRANGGVPLQKSFSVDWWFYDILGNTYPDLGGNNSADKGPDCFGDYMSLDYTSQWAPSNADFASGVPAYSGWTLGGELALGAIEDITGFNDQVYQAYVKGSSLVNTSVARSKGWHHAVISVDGSSVATFYIDNTLVLTQGTNSPNGFNVLTMRGVWNTPGYYNQSAYYDDISVQTIPEPTTLMALGAGLLTLAGLRRRRR